MGITSTASVGGGGRYRGRDRRIDAAASELCTPRSALIVVLVPAVALATGLALLVGREPSAGVHPAKLVVAVLAFLVALAGLAAWRAFGHATGYLATAAGALIGIGLTLHSFGPDLPALLSAVPMALAAVWVARAAVGPTIDTVTGPRRETRRASLALLAGWAVCGLPLLLWTPPASTVATAAVALGVGAWGAALIATAVVRLHHRAPLPLWRAVIVGGLFIAIGAAVSLPAVTGPAATLSLGVAIAGLATALAGTVWWLAAGALGWRDAAYDLVAHQRDQRRRMHAQERATVHEVRTALLAVEGALRSLEQDDAADAADRKLLGDAAAASLDQVRQLLDGGQPETTDLRVHELVRQRVLLATGRGQLTVEVEGDPDLTVGLAWVELTQVVDNLLANAERHAARDGRVHVRLLLDRCGNALRLRCVDDGPGIPEADRERIFSAGCRLDSGREGDGLGLAIVRQVLRERGGDITVVPSPQGATFEVVLPLGPIGRQGGDQTHDGVQVGQVGPESNGEISGERVPDQTSPTPSTGLVVQLHHELGARLRRRRGHDRQVEDLAG